MAKWLEIINPSDQCHIRGEDVQAAQIAILVISTGLYALRDEEGTSVLPILFGRGGWADWLVAEGFVTSEESQDEDLDNWIEANWERLEKALRSVTYGSRSECESQLKALELIDDPAKRQEFIDFNENQRRTSMSPIVKACHSWADKLRRNHAEEVVSG